MVRGLTNLALILCVLMIVPVASAVQSDIEIDFIFEYETQVNLPISCDDEDTSLFCESSYACNVTVYNPDGNILVDNGEMTRRGTDYNITFNVTELGYHKFKPYCYNSTSGGTETRYFLVTGNGNAPPDGFVILGFSIIFLILLAISVGIIVKSIGHLVDADFDFMDIAYNWGLYFAIVGMWILERYYLGNPDVHNWIVLFIRILAFPMIILPIIAIIFTIFMGQRKKKKAEALKW